MSFVIFGAGSFGKTAYKYLKDKFNIEYFCDNSKDKQGKEFCGLKIISPDDLLGKKVIIASDYSVAIAKQIYGLGIKAFLVASYDGKGGIAANEIDLGSYTDLSVDCKKVCLMCTNNSGSNTLALKKLAKNTDYNLVLINEKSITSDYYYHIFTSGTLIKTHESANIDGHINIQLWHGMGPKPVGYMNKFRSKFGEALHNDWKRLDAICTYSQFSNLLLSACYGIPIEKFHITGVPRNDFLFHSNGRELLVDIMNINESHKIILYAPTFRENIFGTKSGSNTAYIYNMDGIDLNEFDNFLGINYGTLVIKLHPRDIEECSQKINGLKNIKILHDIQLYERDLDLYEVLNGVDILITDYSSMYTDYLLLDRPILFTPLDIEKYDEDFGFLFEPYDFWTPGEKVYNYDELKLSIKNILDGKDEYKDKRSEITSIFHKYKDGNSTERVLEKLDKIRKGLITCRT